MSKWISVEEYNPEDSDVNCIVLYRNKRYADCIQKGFGFFIKPKWFVIDSVGCETDINVTHWFPEPKF